MRIKLYFSTPEGFILVENSPRRLALDHVRQDAWPIFQMVLQELHGKSPFSKGGF
jgi:hypothetical protein